MIIRCEYCHSNISDTDAVCPKCGAPNAKMLRSGIGIPKTIEEMQRFVAEKNIPVEALHFYIGQNYHGPKAFGIYKEGNLVVVYKNKSDGTRIERYRGTDEAYAVNEIYQKLRIEFQEAKANLGNASSYTPHTTRQNVRNSNYGSGMPKRRGLLYAAIIAAVVAVLLVACSTLLLASGSSDTSSTYETSYNNGNQHNNVQGSGSTGGHYQLNDNDNTEDAQLWGVLGGLLFSDGDGDSYWNNDNDGGSSWDDDSSGYSSNTWDDDDWDDDDWSSDWGDSDWGDSDWDDSDW